MVLVKNWPFFHLFFKDNIGQENVFYDILERKNAFLGYKNKKFKKSKNCHFSKGVSPWFWSKIGHVSIFFLKVIQADKMCFTIFQNKKNVFLSCKKKKFKKSKNYEFFKGGSSWFLSKIGNFFHYYFLEKIGLENVFHDILKSKNPCLGYKNKQLKKLEKQFFSKGVSPWFLSKSWNFFLFFTENRAGKCTLRYCRK